MAVVRPLWKQTMREVIWEAMEASREIFGQGPLYGRLPPFRGGAFAFNRLTSLEEFQTAKTIKTGVSEREFELRKLVLDQEKHLAIVRPRMQDAALSIMHKSDIPFHYTVADASKREGLDVFGSFIPLKQPSLIDVVVVPSLVVDPQTGNRLGLGEGEEGGWNSDLECGMLKEIGAISEATLLVTCVHPKQLVDLEGQEMESFDVGVDVVFTPGKTYYTEGPRRPKGINWELLQEMHFREAPCLNTMRSERERAIFQKEMKEQTNMKRKKTKKNKKH